MFWFRSSSRDEPSKEKNVKDFCAAFPSARRPNNDDNIFELMFEVDRKYNTLRIFLPNDFPANKPVLQILGPVVHPWLDQYKRVAGCDKLTYWTKNSSLTDVVQDTLGALRSGQTLQGPVRNTFTAQPSHPQPSGHQQNTGNQVPAGRQSSSYQYPPSNQSTVYHQPNIASIPRGVPQSSPLTVDDIRMRAPSSSGAGLQTYYGSNVNVGQRSMNRQEEAAAYEHGTNPPTRTRSQSDEKLHIPLPPIPTSFPELKDLTVTQLERLRSDDSAIKSHIGSLECVESLRTMRDQIRQSNLNDAMEYLSKEDDLREAAEDARNIQNELRQFANEYKKKLAIAGSKYSMNKSVVMPKLREQTETLDASSEQLAQKFVNGEMDMNAFLQGYISERTEYHSLCIKLSRVG